jgi:hypothetical protein
MKFEELKLNDGKNVKLAKRIRALAKDKAKKQNPEESPERGGWYVDPHQGVPNNPRITR